MAKSRVRLLLFVIVTATFNDELEIASIDEYVELSFDNESYGEFCADAGDNSRTVEFEPDEMGKKQRNCNLVLDFLHFEEAWCNKTENKQKQTTK